MKIALASDIHGLEDQTNFPPADVLCLAGDILPNFAPYNHFNPISDAKAQSDYLIRFNQKLSKLPYKHVIFVAGNHDWVFQLIPEAKKLLTNAIYLEDAAIVIDGVKFYGSPWQPWFHNWAFNLPKLDPLSGYQTAKKTWAQIPLDTNVLICHGPPYRILDLCMDGRQVGCPILRDRLRDLTKLKLSVHGHIHHSYGSVEIDGVKYVNASICNEDYQPVNPVQLFDL